MNYIMRYGLEYNPFIKSNTDILYESSDYKETIFRLNYLKDIKGFGVITGEAGKGKTTIIRLWSKALNRSLYKIIYIPLSTLTVNEFYRMLASELGIETYYRKNQNFKAIQGEISRLTNDKKITPIIIIDEANTLKSATLGDLKILFNFEMDSQDKAVVILVGLPILNNILNLNVHEPLRQRITISYHLEGLTKIETKEYIKAKLKGANGILDIFSEEALDALANCSNGIARQIDRIANRAMLLGDKVGTNVLDSEIIMKSYDDLLLE
ncbi:MAG: AAA family ATPase [Bacilli bacterium]|nr:AAA family ATPase [Bacilli bacterium]